MSYADVSFEERMASVEFRVAERAHITVDAEVCRSCTTKDCVHACPAGLFVPTTDGGILFNYEQCFECGTCYQVCNKQGAITWTYPRRRRRRRIPEGMREHAGDRCRPELVLARDRGRPAHRGGKGQPLRPRAGRPRACGLEHALRLGEKWDARVVAASVAPAAADEMLRDALAVGAAQALRVEPAGWMARPRPAGLVGGEQQSAAALAAALRQHCGVPDLVLCGDAAADRATGSFPAFLAASLGAAQALGCVRLEPVDKYALRVHRRLDGGRREVLMVRPPAVVSVEAAGVRLRRAGLPATLARENAAITVASTSAAAAARRIRILGAHPYRPRPRPRELPGPSGTALRRTLELTGALVPRTPPTVLGPLPPEEAADELLAYLRRSGYLAAGDPE